MLATPRPALLLLLLLHIPRAARAQVNPGKSDRDQVAAALLLPDGQVWTCIVSIISGIFSALGAVCDGPKPAPALSLCCPAPHLGTCSDLQSPSPPATGAVRPLAAGKVLDIAKHYSSGL